MRAQFRERLADESSRRALRMRQVQVGLVHDHVAEIKQIQVDGPWRVRDSATNPQHVRFDGVDGPRPVENVAFDIKEGNGIQKRHVGEFRRDIYWLGLVDGRLGDKCYTAELGKSGDGIL